MPARYRHYGWSVSPYSAKTRAYMTYKGVAFDDIEPSGARLFGPIRRAVGRSVMPTVLTPEGAWLQDSSDIIDTLERRHPAPSVIPPGPRQRIASLLLELHADEWLPLVAMHTRWNRPENARFAVDEFARSGFPRLPRALGRRLIRPIAAKMRGYLPPLGVTPETAPGIERHLARLLDALERQLAAQPYVLGGRPCIGDFALFGPLWAHVYRDPDSTYMFDDSPSVRAWMQRLRAPASAPADAAFLPDDQVPEALDPLFRQLFAEQFAYVLQLADAIDRYCDEHPDATRVPRSLGDHPFSIGGAQGTRKLITFTWWMAQRPLDVYRSLDASARAPVDAWLDRVGGREAMQRPVRNRFVREDFKMKLARV